MMPADEDEKRPAITITVSIGVTRFDQQVTDHHVLIERADKALYKAKEGGVIESSFLIALCEKVQVGTKRPPFF
jgi:PleD family two-component response regulator